MNKSLLSASTRLNEKKDLKPDPTDKDELVLSGDLLHKLETIELYVCELMDVMADYESQSQPSNVLPKPVAEGVPVEFMKWDLLNLIAESRVDAVVLKSKLKKKQRSPTSPMLANMLN